MSRLPPIVGDPRVEHKLKLLLEEAQHRSDLQQNIISDLFSLLNQYGIPIGEECAKNMKRLMNFYG